MPHHRAHPVDDVFFNAFRTSPIGIALENMEGQPLFVNPALCKLLELTQEEMLSKHCVDFSPRDDAEKDWAFFEQLRAGVIDHYQLDKRYFRRNGSLVWGNLTVCLLNGGSQPLVMAMVEDITERKLAENKLQEYEEAIERTEEMIVVVDRDYRYVSANRTYLRNRNLTSDQVIGRQICEVVQDGTFETVIKKKLDECFTGKIVTYDLKHSYAEASDRELAISYFPIKGPEGFDRVVCILQDITNRKSTEQALRISEERLRLAQQAARMGSFEWDVKSGVVTWTPEMYAVYGLRPGGFDGRRETFYSLVHPEDRERVRVMSSLAMQSGLPSQGEWRIVWPDGSPHWISARWQVFMDEQGEPARVIGVNTDITERKQAEEELKKSEERFRLAAHAAKMFAFEWDPSTDVVLRSAESISLLEPDEPRDTTGRQITSRIHPDDREMVSAAVAALTPEGPALRVTYCSIRPSGKTIWAELHGIAHFDASGKLLRIIGMVADIGERKKAEQALADVRGRLIHAQEEERARIARDLHDDINQRLAMLTMEIDQLQNHFPKSAAERNRRLEELKQSLIDVSGSVQSLSHQLHPSQLQYLGLVGAMRSFCRDFSEGQRTNVEFTAQHVSENVPQDLSLTLFRVLQEAVRNAAKHGKAQRIKVDLNSSSNELQLTISDNGSGFDSDKAGASGGLGLISMQERMRLVGGTITVDSTSGGGTTVRVTAPLRPENSLK